MHSFSHKSRTGRWCASLCTATNKKLVTFLFWTATKTNYKSKYSDFQKKLIDNITISKLYLKFKDNNKNDMAVQVFWAVFYSSQRPSKIRSIADFDNTAIPLPIFSMVDNQICSEKLIAINENSFNFRNCMIPKRLHKNAKGYCFFLKIL